MAIVVIGAMAGWGVTGTATGAAVPKTIVTLTFDDGNADQLAAEQVMKAHGLVGTFFITTGWVDTPSYLTQENLRTIAADGNEIGGHTVTHPDLTKVTAAVATKEICDGRTTLTGWGFSVTDFAYPFAAENPSVEKLVKACGYSSARNLGDIRSPASCPACPYAETIPPANPYNTAAPDEVDSTWTLQNLQDLVTNAETHGGGWVQLTFHHIAVGTDPTLTISPTLFAQFVSWLAARTGSGTTVVETVAQALGTSPPPPPPPNVAPTAGFSSSVQGLVATFDGSTSTDSDGTVVSYGWDFGDGSAVATGAKPVHTYAAAGTYQVKLTVTDNLGAIGSVTRPVVVKVLPSSGAVVPVAPARIMDTRSDPGSTGAVKAGGTVSLQVTGKGGVPASGVSAVVVNVTAVNPTAAGFITVWPSGSPKQTTSNLNFRAGQTIPNLVVVPVGADGKIQLFNGSAGTVNLLADVTGYIVAGIPAAPGAVVPLSPARIMDTRNPGSGGPVKAGGTVSLQVTGKGGIPAAGVSAVVVNVTAVNPTAAGYITVWPSGTTKQTTSNLNFQAGQTIPNLVVVPVGSDGKIQLYNGSAGTVQLVADVTGYILAGTPTALGTVASLSPARILDTRTPGSGGPVKAGGTVSLQVTGKGKIPATGVSAVVVNVTAVNPTAAGFITVWPSGTTKQTTSNLNFQAGQTIPNLVVVPVGADGKIQLFNGSAGTVQLVADVTGYIIAGG